MRVFFVPELGRKRDLLGIATSIRSKYFSMSLFSVDLSLETEVTSNAHAFLTLLHFFAGGDIIR